jgi:hypothetical protein
MRDREGNQRRKREKRMKTYEGCRRASKSMIADVPEIASPSFEAFETAAKEMTTERTK